MWRKALCSWVVWAVAWACIPPAWAVLGDAPSLSGEAINLSLRAVRKGTASVESYTVVERDTGGTKIREYVAQSGPQAGKVFGLAWQGLTNPDLSALLGEYASEHRLTRQRMARTHGRRMLARSARVVVEQWGQMRNLQGRAYLPGRLPSGVTVDEIR